MDKDSSELQRRNFFQRGNFTVFSGLDALNFQNFDNHCGDFKGPVRVDHHEPFLATISKPYMEFMVTWQPYS